MARFAVNNLGDHECLVLETLTKKQALFVWRADLTTPQTLGLPGPSEPQTEASPETPLESPEERRREGNLVLSYRTQSSEDRRSSGAGQTQPGPATRTF